MSGMVTGLDTPCPACGRVSGDHTLREWATCLGQGGEDLPYAPVPDDMAQILTARLRQQFRLDDDMILADFVVVKAGTLDASSGPMKTLLPVLIHEFAVGNPLGPPVVVAKVLYFASPDGIRQYGKLVQNSAEGAAAAVVGRSN